MMELTGEQINYIVSVLRDNKYTMDDIARECGVSRSTPYNWMECGTKGTAAIAMVDLVRRLFTPEDAEQLLEGGEVSVIDVNGRDVKITSADYDGLLNLGLQWEDDCGIKSQDEFGEIWLDRWLMNAAERQYVHHIDGDIYNCTRTNMKLKDR